MKTYLIFFGKSQDFTFYAFDREKSIASFDSIIKDFDELESKYFTTDDISNKQILAKYNFSKNGESFSLLKLYSLAQAYNGTRIDGSIYGVALLSDKDIKIEENNIAILESAKNNFAKLSLEGLKFKNSDFFEEVNKIWSALTNHSNGNYLDKVSYNNSIIGSVNNKIKAFWVKDLLEQPTELNDESKNTSRLYFSQDLKHLKRTQERRGKGVFPIYYKDKGSYILYEDKKNDFKGINISTEGEEHNRLKLEIGNLKREITDRETSFSKYKRESSKRIKTISVLAGVFLLTSIIFFFTSNFFSTSQDTSDDRVDEISTKESNENIESKNQLIFILNEENQRNTLKILITNIEEYLKGKEPDKYLKAINRDIESLGINLNELHFIKDETEETKPITEEIKNSPNLPEESKREKTKNEIIQKEIKDTTNKKNNIVKSDSIKQDSKKKKDSISSSDSTIINQ